MNRQRIVLVICVVWALVATTYAFIQRATVKEQKMLIDAYDVAAHQMEQRTNEIQETALKQQQEAAENAKRIFHLLQECQKTKK